MKFEIELTPQQEAAFLFAAQQKGFDVQDAYKDIQSGMQEVVSKVFNSRVPRATREFLAFQESMQQGQPAEQKRGRNGNGKESNGKTPTASEVINGQIEFAAPQSKPPADQNKPSPDKKKDEPVK